MTSIKFEWQRWAAFSLMSGVSIESVTERMVAEGIYRAAVTDVGEK